MNEKEIPDYTELTCTNLMLRLKIRLNKLSPGDSIEFYSNREQYDNIRKPFSKDPYEMENEKVDKNKYHIKIRK
jgi:TusA-related sulfurtransferase